MSDENTIREKTSVLFNAYLELSGFSGELSVSDFLSLRKTAREELREDGGVQKKIKKMPAEKTKADLHREKSTSVLSSTSVFNPDSSLASNTASSVYGEKKKEAEEGNDGEVKKDDYEILREMEDPWN